MRFLGYDPAVVKTFAFVVAAGMAGLAGALAAPSSASSPPTSSTVLPSILMVCWVAVGGRGTLYGRGHRRPPRQLGRDDGQRELGPTTGCTSRACCSSSSWPSPPAASSGSLAADSAQRLPRAGATPTAPSVEPDRRRPAGRRRRRERALLELRGLVVDFDGFQAARRRRPHVEQGELRFLIGPNGAGKTTLIDVHHRADQADRGRRSRSTASRLAGVSASTSGVRLGIGRSFQTPTVFDALTVVENLDLAETFRVACCALLRRRRGVSDGVAAHAGADRAAATSRRPPGRRAQPRPEAVAGDRHAARAGAQAAAARRAGRRHERRRSASTPASCCEELAGDHTVVVIEHDMAFLRRFARTVTVLHEGKVLSEGTVDEVQADPRVREVYLGPLARRALGGRGAVASSAAAEVSADAARDRRPRASPTGAPRCCSACRSTCPTGALSCLMGRNGVGKTTLLNAVMGLLPAAVGRDPPRRRGHHAAWPPYERARPGSATCPRATRCSRS